MQQSIESLNPPPLPFLQSFDHMVGELNLARLVLKKLNQKCQVFPVEYNSVMSLNMEVFKVNSALFLKNYSRVQEKNVFKG